MLKCIMRKGNYSFSHIITNITKFFTFSKLLNVIILFDMIQS